jgi:hypothetical protein
LLVRCEIFVEVGDADAELTVYRPGQNLTGPH